MRRGIAAVLALTVLAGVARADDKKTDAEKIRGAWKVVTAKETRGDDPNADIPEYKDSVWAFGEKEFTVTKGKAETELAYRLDPAMKPKEIDLGKNLAGKNDQRPLVKVAGTVRFSRASSRRRAGSARSWGCRAWWFGCR